jgi:N-acetylglucosamine-6-phosphate deacetylase
VETHWIDNVRMVFPGEAIATGSLRIDAGRIAEIRRHPVKGTPPLLTPGLIDVHTHGIGRNLYERDRSDLGNCQKMLSSFGTTTVLPTLYRVMNRQSLKHLMALAEMLLGLDGVNAPGFHLEGPFLAYPGAGAETIAGDLQLLDKLIKACNGRVAAMSISPDTPNVMRVIERLREYGIVPFITHTRASVEQTQAAIDAGARHATHFYDVFLLPPESDSGVRPVGAVETILADKRVTVDFIADGTHVHPMAIRCAIAAKGWQGIVLITDSNIGAGLPAGVYETGWGFPVITGPQGGARNADPKHPLYGKLAGSTLTMNIGMKNLLDWLDDLPAEQVWAMGTLNPARLLGLERKGRMEVGADADLVLWDQELNALKTWVAGKCVYEKV